MKKLKTTKANKLKLLPKMLAVRASRESALAFYNKFKKFNIDYVAAAEKQFSPSIGKISSNMNIISAKFKPTFGIDPVTLIQGKINNLSWVDIEGLDNLIKKTDLVNLTDTYYFFNAQAARLAKKYKKPVVTIIWTTLPNHPSVWLPPYSLNVREVLSVTDLYILRCKSAYAFTDSLKIPRSKIKLIYKGVDLKHFYPAVKKRNKVIKILYVGNLHESKGIRDLLYVFERLYKEGHQIKLLLAGNGDLLDEVNNKAQELPIVHYGFVPYKDLASIYREGDIFVSPSKPLFWVGIKIWEEYFSYTLMEAQASGLPIVATQTGGIPEEVHPDNPLVAPGDREALYRAVKKLVLSPKLRHKLGKINRERAEDLFDDEKQAELTEKVILDLYKSRYKIK